MFRKSVMAAAVAMAIGVAEPASAATIFSDLFTRSNNNTVGNGWTEQNDSANDVSIDDNELRMRDEGALASHGASTTGFTNIVLSYDWKTFGDTESSDRLYVGWRVGSSGAFTVLANHALNASGWQDHSVTLSGAANRSLIQFAFWTEVSQGEEGIWLDNVFLTGDAVTSVAAVPEPASLLLLGTGLAGLAARARRRRGARA